MRKILILGGLMALFYSCKDDDARTCINCSSAITPAFKLCRESDGNASVNGQNTNISYDVYLDGLVAEGANCD